MPHILPRADTSGISDEEYLVLRAKETDKNPYRSKAWTLTARTLFPQNFGVQVRTGGFNLRSFRIIANFGSIFQFEAYLIEKSNGNAKEAAKIFSEL